MATATNPLTPDQVSGSTLIGLGDIRFVANYQGFLEDRNLGVQVGVKTPTGRYGGANADGTGIVGRRPIAFDTGPIAQRPSPDNLVDTSLQPGNGSTDVILGVYYHQPVSENFDGFVSAQFQAAVAHKLDQVGADFRPGNTWTGTFGVRYEASADDRAAAAGEHLSQGRRPGRACRQPRQRRHRRLPEPRRDLLGDRQAAGLRLRAGACLQQPDRLPARAALDGVGGAQLFVLKEALDPGGLPAMHRCGR